MNKSFFALIESSAGIAGYESIPAKLDNTIYNIYGEQFQFKNIKDIINDPKYKNIILLTKDKNDWIGYITYGKNEKAIYNLEVNPKFRRMGYAKKLLGYFPDYEYLHVNKDNEPAIKLYKDIGLKESNIFAYEKYYEKPNNIVLYNPKNVPQLYKQNKEKNLYLNITIPKHAWYYIKGYIRKKENGKETYIPINKLIKRIKHSDNPSTKLIRTSNDNLCYIILNNISKDKPITINQQNPIHEDFGMIHESIIF